MNASHASAAASPARTRLLETASNVYDADDIRHVGVDRVIAETQVTRATRHFPSKEDLVLAHVEERDQQIRSAVTEAFRTTTDPEALLVMSMAGIGEEICGPGSRGCPFINAAAESPGPNTPSGKPSGPTGPGSGRPCTTSSPPRALRTANTPRPCWCCCGTGRRPGATWTIPPQCATT